MGRMRTCRSVAALPGTAMVWLAAAVYLDYRPTNMSGIAGLYAQVLVLHLLIGSLASYTIRRSLRNGIAKRDRRRRTKPRTRRHRTPRPRRRCSPGCSRAREPRYFICACRITTSRYTPRRAWSCCCCAFAMR